MNDPRLGTMHPTDRCPIDNNRIMVNAVGNRWCTGDDCEYHVRDGQLVTAAYVKRLGDRCPIR
jgi:hypothetical protein